MGFVCRRSGLSAGLIHQWRDVSYLQTQLVNAAVDMHVAVVQVSLNNSTDVSETLGTKEPFEEDLKQAPLAAMCDLPLTRDLKQVMNARRQSVIDRNNVKVSTCDHQR